MFDGVEDSAEHQSCTNVPMGTAQTQERGCLRAGRPASRRAWGGAGAVRNRGNSGGLRPFGSKPASPARWYFPDLQLHGSLYLPLLEQWPDTAFLLVLLNVPGFQSVLKFSFSWTRKVFKETVRRMIYNIHQTETIYSIPGSSCQNKVTW